MLCLECDQILFGILTSTRKQQLRQCESHMRSHSRMRFGVELSCSKTLFQYVSMIVFVWPLIIYLIIKNDLSFICLYNKPHPVKSSQNRHIDSIQSLCFILLCCQYLRFIIMCTIYVFSTLWMQNENKKITNK